MEYYKQAQELLHGELQKKDEIIAKLAVLGL